MANIHAVDIKGTVPFDWASKLEGREAEMFASWFLSPDIGIELAYGSGSLEHPFLITGEEAIRFSAIVEIVEILLKRGAVIQVARARDVENNTIWFDVLDEIAQDVNAS